MEWNVHVQHEPTLLRKYKTICSLEDVMRRITSSVDASQAEWNLYVGHNTK
jgi:hypothetical protein